MRTVSFMKTRRFASCLTTFHFLRLISNTSNISFRRLLKRDYSARLSLFVVLYNKGV